MSNDIGERNVFILIGGVKRTGESGMTPFNALVCAADDDTAVRSVLEALAQEGYEEADLHQIGNLDDAPEEEEFQPAYEAALAGEVALLIYEGGYDFHNPEVED